MFSVEVGVDDHVEGERLRVADVASLLQLAKLQNLLPHLETSLATLMTKSNQSTKLSTHRRKFGQRRKKTNRSDHPDVDDVVDAVAEVNEANASKGQLARRKQARQTNSILTTLVTKRTNQAAAEKDTSRSRPGQKQCPSSSSPIC
jgi:multidrug efflux pump subunit AcrB